MNRGYKILLFILILFSNYFAQVTDSTSKDVRCHFYFENDVSGCINYIFNSSKTLNRIYFNYINGGIGISLHKKQNKLLSSDFYLSYNYLVSVRKLSNIQKEYSTGISYYNEKEIFKNILLEHRLFYNRKGTNRGFYTNLGFGIGNYSHMFDNFTQIKKQNWNLIGGLGYKFIIKRFFIDAHLSMLTLSTYKDVQDYNKDMSSYPAFPLTFGQDDNAKNYVKKIEFDGNSKITRTYKYFGIVNSGFIPRFGINIGFRF